MHALAGLEVSEPVVSPIARPATALSARRRGYKVEGGCVNFLAVNNARLEVLGGVANEHGFNKWPPGENAIVRIENSRVSYVGCTNGPGRFVNIIGESREGKTHRLTWDKLPPRM